MQKWNWNVVETHESEEKNRENPVTLQDDYDAPPHPEDGGYDVAWPSVWISDILSIVASLMLKQSKGEDEHEEFSATVAETVNEKGCPSRQGSVAT